MLRISVSHRSGFPQIRKKQCLKRIPNLVISRTVLLTLTSNNSRPTIGVE